MLFSHYLLLSRLCYLSHFYRELIPEWNLRVHPDGQFYFYTDSRTPRYVTLANLNDEDVLDEMTRFMRRMDKEIQEQQRQQKQLPDDMEVFLEVLPGGHWSYYMVDHRSRTLFWLDEVDTEWFAGEVGGLASLSHLRMASFPITINDAEIKPQNTTWNTSTGPISNGFLITGSCLRIS